jgi:hypothetical protein
MTVRRLFQDAGRLCVATIVVLALVAPSLGRVTFVLHHLTAIFAARPPGRRRYPGTDHTSHRHDGHDGHLRGVSRSRNSARS